MDAKRFDTLARALREAGTRRGLLAFLTTLPVLDGLVALLDPDETEAKGRRKRRKKKHKHGKGRDKGKHQKKCKPHAKTKTCAGKCGSVKNNCKQTVDCGPCTCDPVCPAGDACCGGDCADLLTDHTHCGSCENACGSSQLCVDGACQDCDVTCPGGTCTGTALQAELNGGGTVTVCPGRYTGNFSLTANVTVIGAGQGEDPSVDTILDAQQSGRVVDIPQDRTVALRRLRITGGQVTNAVGGAGVRHFGTRLTMTDCTVSHNQTTANESRYARGAIFNDRPSRLEMTGCTIHDNTVSNDGTGGGLGGGIYNDNQLVLTDCVIRNNAVKSAGGGLWNNGGTSELTNCRITENSVGGITVNTGSATLTDSFVWDNTAPDCAGNVTASGSGGCGVEPPPA